jgi:hypothetical protein
MNKIISKFVVLTVLSTAAAGCSTIQNITSSNANAEDKTRETLGLKKTGIPECDEVVEILSKKAKGNSNTEDESWTDRAAAELVKQQIYNYINGGNTNKTPAEKSEMAGKCKTALGYLKDNSKK